MAEKTHWKKLHNPNYLGAYSLNPGEDVVLTIDRVQTEIVTGADARKEECTVAHFRENVKPMILNVTNSKTISKIAGSPYIEDWRGVKIQIYAAMVKAFGEEVEALRIRKRAPQTTKPILDQNYKGWEAAVNALKNGETSLDVLQKKYTIPAACLTILQEAITNA